MATFALFPLCEVGHLHSFFGLARSLVRRGHRVTFLTLEDGIEHIVREGFEYRAVLTRPFPRGLTARLEQLFLTWGGMGFLERRRQMRKLFLAELGYFQDEDLERALEELRPDLVLVDHLLTPALLALKLRGVRAVQVATNLMLGEAPDVPPTSTPLVPDRTVRFRFQNFLAWRRLHASRRWADLLKALQCPEFQWRFERTLFAAHVRRRWFEDSLDLGLPTLVMCSPELDLPRSRPPPHLFYGGPCLDLERKEAPLSLDGLEALPGELIFCSLGSQTHRFAHAVDFFRALIAAVARMPHRKLLLTVGRHLPGEQLGPLPPNVRLVEYAPQLQVLARASLMLSHGGYSSVKECIYHRVPLIIFPLGRDQPGVSSRIAYHRLGLREDLERATAESLATQIDQVLGEPGYAQRVAAMADALRRDQTSDKAAHWLESLAEARAA